MTPRKTFHVGILLMLMLWTACRHPLHVRWSHMSTVAFCWHGKVTRHKWMPVDVQPELVNIYFQACCCHSWTCAYYIWASLSSCGKDNWEIVKPVVKALYLELYIGFAPTDETNCKVDIYIHALSIHIFFFKKSPCPPALSFHTY